MKSNKKLSITAILAASLSLTASAFVIDWNKIEHWAGEGPRKAALVVQFVDGGEERAYVWGYRWTGDDDVQPSGEDMFRAISAECSDLYLFTQFTGPMGSTVGGIGYSEDNAVAEAIEYDFETALEDPCISFNWFTPNALLGQKEAPGWDTPDLCEQAIEEARQTHILDHPINAATYGYACYDYDHWLMMVGDPAIRWQAGWYKGYWSYWVGGADSESLSYSGLGFTSRKLSDGAVDAWKFTILDGPVGGGYVDGATGASAPWYEPDYSHFNTAGIESPATDESATDRVKMFRIDGTPIAADGRNEHGVYIIIENNKAKKIIK